jgi:hypothetical protein
VIFCKSKGVKMILKTEICFILRQITENLRLKRVKENLEFERQYVNLREDFFEQTALLFQNTSLINP